MPVAERQEGFFFPILQMGKTEAQGRKSAAEPALKQPSVLSQAWGRGRVGGNLLDSWGRRWEITVHTVCRAWREDPAETRHCILHL